MDIWSLFVKYKLVIMSDTLLFCFTVVKDFYSCVELGNFFLPVIMLYFSSSFFFIAQQPLWAKVSSLLRLRDHTQIHHAL
jgi:hypothetical protein